MLKNDVSSAETVRLQFELDAERVEELDVLMRECGIRTRTALMNSALMFFQWAVRELKQGKIIASVDEQNAKYKEVVLPGFEAVRARTVREQKKQRTMVPS